MIIPEEILAQIREIKDIFKKFLLFKNIYYVIHKVKKYNI